MVKRSTEALEGSVGRYTSSPSVSVYSDFSEGPSEDSPRAELGDMPADEMLPEYENYGALKALCEDAVWEVYGDRATIVRPGLIVGPHDPTGRFTYWPHRAARGGEIVVPRHPSALSSSSTSAISAAGSSSCWSGTRAARSTRLARLSRGRS